MSEVREAVVKRINECSVVVNDLNASPVWQVIVGDLEGQRKLLDDKWQDIPDGEKLQKARVLKNAVAYVLNIKDQYAEELAARQRELFLIDNPESEITKDYDNETAIDNG